MLILKNKSKLRIFSTPIISKLKSLSINLLYFLIIALSLFATNIQAQKIQLADRITLEQINYLDINYSYKNQNRYFDQNNSNYIDNDNNNFTSELISSWQITKKSSKSKKIGFFSNFRANYNNNNDQNNQYYLYLEKSYLFYQNKIGQIELGRNIPINQKMAVSSYNFARGSGGVSGNYLQYVNLPILQNSNNSNISQIGSCLGYGNSGDFISENGNCSNIKLPKFILLPTMPISHGGYATGFYNNIFDNNYNNRNINQHFGFSNNRSQDRVNADNSLGNLHNSLKFNYYSNRIQGFQFGIGQTLNAKNDFELDAIDNSNINLRNIYSWGLNYSNYFDNIGFAASITGEYGKVNNRYQRNNLNSYAIGAMLTYFGFSIGGSYGNWGQSLMPKYGIYSCDYNSNLTIDNQDCQLDSNRFQDAYYLNAGISYEFGPFGSSLTYLRSNFQENIYQASVFSLDYKLKKSVKSYLELAKFQFDSNHSRFFDGINLVNQENLSNNQRQITDNMGYIILIGMLFNF